MSRREIGIEEARKKLGDLVTSAQQGAEIVITRNNKPAAQLVAIKEDTMRSLSPETCPCDYLDEEPDVEACASCGHETGEHDENGHCTVVMTPWAEDEQ